VIYLADAAVGESAGRARSFKVLVDDASAKTSSKELNKRVKAPRGVPTSVHTMSRGNGSPFLNDLREETSNCWTVAEIASGLPLCSLASRQWHSHDLRAYAGHPGRRSRRRRRRARSRRRRGAGSRRTNIQPLSGFTGHPSRPPKEPDSTTSLGKHEMIIGQRKPATASSRIISDCFAVVRAV
jgi:hypothetical protein